MLADQERAGLRLIRARRRAVWIAWLGIVPAAAMVAEIASRSFSNRVLITEAGLSAIFLTWIGAIVASSFVRCPRCQKFFYRVTQRRQFPLSLASHWNPWRRSCGNCGLSLDELESED